MLLVEWAVELGVHASTILARLDRGWSIERAVTTEPKRPRRERIRQLETKGLEKLKKLASIAALQDYLDEEPERGPYAS
jgi:hypothetical protein